MTNLVGEGWRHLFFFCFVFSFLKPLLVVIIIISSKYYYFYYYYYYLFIYLFSLVVFHISPYTRFVRSTCISNDPGPEVFVEVGYNNISELQYLVGPENFLYIMSALAQTKYALSEDMSPDSEGLGAAIEPGVGSLSPVLIHISPYEYTYKNTYLFMG